MNETANHRENKMPMSTSAARQDVTACILCSRNCGLSVEVENNQFIYVNRGTGYWGPPQRFLIPSEITEIQWQS